jgi:hypothetical protein
MRRRRWQLSYFARTHPKLLVRIMSEKAPPSARIPKTGSIVFGRAKITCIIGSLSAFGAALDVIGSTEGIPDQFELTVAPETAVRRCAVVWRKGRRIAVAFY